jgi:A/G-specific adenine glycosylase
LTIEAVCTDRNGSLQAWFASHARDLPWRRTTDPYAVLVSEVMLQQTQVSRVVPQYEQFISLWPSAGSLAVAEAVELLKAWSGLGYNTRALRLREATRVIAAHGWPESLRGLEDLPGVGPYTAAAVGSISFGLDVPALDTNLRRVLSRWAGEPLSGSSLKDFAFEVVGSPAGDWNQALMDLGSAVCTPKEPTCSSCPVSTWCADPAVYESPPRQSAFEGSHRQLRGALLRAHLEGRDLHRAGKNLGRTNAEIEKTLDALHSDGLVRADR